MKGGYEVPFDADGNQHHYPLEPWDRGGTVWRPNHEFDDELTFAGYARGRSAAYFAFKRKDGAGVTVFLKEFEAMVPHMVRGAVSGRFTFVKRGQNYGCVLVRAA